MALFSHAPTPPPPFCSARTTTPARPHTCRRCRAASGAHFCGAFVADDSRPTAAACIAVALTEVVRDLLTGCELHVPELHEDDGGRDVVGEEAAVRTSILL